MNSAALSRIVSVSRSMVLEEVRENVGPWFPIIVRISAEERVPGGNTLEDTLEYLRISG